MTITTTAISAAIIRSLLDGDGRVRCRLIATGMQARPPITMIRPRTKGSVLNSVFNVPQRRKTDETHRNTYRQRGVSQTSNSAGSRQLRRLSTARMMNTSATMSSTNTTAQSSHREISAGF